MWVTSPMLSKLVSPIVTDVKMSWDAVWTIINSNRDHVPSTPWVAWGCLHIQSMTLCVCTGQAGTTSFCVDRGVCHKSPLLLTDWTRVGLSHGKEDAAEAGWHSTPCYTPRSLIKTSHHHLWCPDQSLPHNFWMLFFY